TFWVSFPELRPLLANHTVFNPHNEAQELSFDDLFIKRMFSCYIIKEDNQADRMIADYKGPNTLNALLEAESIKNGIMQKEHDMWQH
ncbi:MAG TPA: gliding motility protein GldN, partial [Bacteroidia bacterium]|nr:gliding motility protein GldN [Bacteroidia bacterium]